MAVENYIIDLIQSKRADAATWTSDNPVLMDGEFGFERDTGKLKIGNGVDDWITLGYVGTAGTVTQLLDLSDVGSATAANRNALLGDGIDFESRAIVLADVSDYSGAQVVSDLDTELGNTRWKVGELPTGGTANQVLTKNSGTNYDVVWATEGVAHTIQEEGSNLAARTNLNFIGADITATDNPGNDATDITVSVSAPSTIVGISGTKAQFNTELSDGTFLYVGDAPTAHTHTLSEITDITAIASEVNLLDLSGLTAGWVLSADTATTASWKAPSGGGGDVSSTGTPVNNQLAVWTDASTIEGDSNLTWDTSTLSVTGNISTSTTISLSGATSGTSTISAPAIAGTSTFTLPSATDTIVGRASTDTFTNKTFDANGTGNSLSNVDVADLANGTDGELITWSAAGTPTTVAVGTVDHVLTSGGTGVAPTFQALPCEIGVAASDEDTALTTGTAKVTFRMPYAMTVTSVKASLTGAGSTSGTTTVDINDGGTTILSTKLTIDQGETTSATAATAAVISDSALADDAEITIDIDAVTGGADETGLKIWLIGTRA